MAEEESHTTHHLSDQHRFPPTVVGHTRFSNGLELHLLDQGDDDKPRYVWIPDEGETEYAL